MESVKVLRKITFIALVAFCFLLFPINGKYVMASSDIVASGDCNESVHWSLDYDGMLTVYGNGSIDDYSSVENVPWYSYRKLIKSISVEDGIVYIGSHAFQEEPNLVSVSMADSVTGMGNQVFWDSEKLKSVLLSDNITYIGYSVFEQCYALETINIPSSLTSIPAYTFDFCQELTEIELPSSVQEIKSGAFQCCKKLHSLNIPEGVTSLERFTFNQCESLSHLDLPSTLTSLDASTFQYSGIEEITIPQGMETVQRLTFEGCSKLKTVTLPDSVKTIEEGAFYGCSSLCEIDLSSNIEQIENVAFYGCDLGSITLSSSLLSIGEKAFQNSNLDHIYFLGNAPMLIDENAFSGVTATAYYYADANWNESAFQNYGGAITWKERCRTCTWNDGEITTEATCTEDGVKTFTCVKCGDTKIEVIKAKGHKWNDEYNVDKEATCAEEGSKSIHCSVCNAIDESTVTVIAKSDHNYGDWKVTKEATCTEDGSKEKVCEVCGDKVTEVIPATGHSFSEEFITDTPASCTTDGSKSRHCAHCDEITDVTVIPATGHTFGEWVEVTASTCENEGLRQHTCEVCGTVESENLDPKGHDFDEEYTVDVPATCTTDGSQSRHCKNCDALTDSVVIPATGHSFGDWDVTKEATCVETGLKERICSVCSEKETEIIPLTDHSWETNPTVDIAATCEENGSQSIHCAICGAKDESTVTVIPKTGHEWNVPTYTWSEDNSTVTATRTCRNDSSHKESETVKSTSEVTKAATYTEKGETTYTAVFDNEVFTKQTKTVADIPVLERTSIEKATVSNVVAKIYTGKALTQTPTIKVGTKTLKSGTDYKLTYKNNKNVGKATVTITGIGAYKGTISKTFQINPKGRSIKSVTPASKAITVKWVKQAEKMSTSYISGYQIYLATDSKFTKNVKKLYVEKYSTVSKKITGLKAKTKYYVKMRTYKTVAGVKYYSPWCSVKTVTTMK